MCTLLGRIKRNPVNLFSDLIDQKGGTFLTLESARFELLMPCAVLIFPSLSFFPPKIMVFNRVRAMTSDTSTVLEAMRRSSELDLLEQVTCLLSSRQSGVLVFQSCACVLLKRLGRGVSWVMTGKGIISRGNEPPFPPSCGKRKKHDTSVTYAEIC